MDDMLTRNALNLLGYSPLMFLLNGYWMFSNKQMFEGVMSSIASLNDRMETSHTFDSVFELG